MILSHVLVVEDSKTIQNLIKKEIGDKMDLTLLQAESFAETKAIVETCPNISLALLDLVLPDSQNGEVVAYIRALKIPCIVMTSSLSEEVRERILSMDVIDYFIKDDFFLKNVASVLNRIQQNHDITILIVDESRTAREHVRRYLELYNFQTLQAGSAKEATDILKKNKTVKILITGYVLPEMSGTEFIKSLRKTYSREQLAIIGISSMSSPMIPVELIKHGADDFISKPFVKEELTCRVSRCVETLDLLAAFKELSVKDELSELYNRRHFYSHGSALFKEAEPEQKPFTVVMNIDNFKSINDKFGQILGDKVIKHVAMVLKKAVKKGDILARTGGKEFSLVVTSQTLETISDYLDSMREQVAKAIFPAPGNKPLKVTLSMGACCSYKPTLEESLKLADNALYLAKQNGKNRLEQDVVYQYEKVSPGRFVRHSSLT